MKKTLAPLFSSLSFFLLFRSVSLQEGALFLLSALLHEGGHVLTAALLGYPPRSFSLSPSGLTLGLDFSLTPYKKEILIYLAGPLSNALAAIATFVLIRFFSDLHLFYFLFCNLLFFFINLLPVEGLDGYCCLFSLVCLRRSPARAKDVLAPVSSLVLFSLLPAGILLFAKTGNFSLFLFFLMLFSEGQTKKATNLS